MPLNVHVKICGITRAEDADLAARLGARYCGFIFAPKSPRCVSPDRAAEIIDTLPDGVIPVGVFADEPRDRVLDIVSATGIRMAQFHGDETPEYCASFGPFSVMKAFRVRSPFGVDDVAAYHTDMILLDTYHPTQSGGTGQTFDWSLAEPVAREFRVMLAGGLNPDNVARAVEAVRPYGVDAGSGVEAEPGIKDPGRLAAFFRGLEQAGHLAPKRTT